MLTAEFGSLNLKESSQSKFISLDKMLSVFDIYILDEAEECYLLIPRAKQMKTERTPLIRVNHGEAELIEYDNAPNSEYRKLIQQFLFPSTAPIDSIRLSDKVKTSLHTIISQNLEYQDKRDKNDDSEIHLQ